jgi:hypothetical protein
MTGMPHKVVGNEHAASFKRVHQCHLATLANERCGAIHLDHGEPSAGGCNGVAFSCVSLLSSPQCFELGVEGAAIDYFGRTKFISHVFHRFLPC